MTDRQLSPNANVGAGSDRARSQSILVDAVSLDEQPRCRRCHHPIFSAVSVRLGLGPVCRLRLVGESR